MSHSPNIPAGKNQKNRLIQNQSNINEANNTISENSITMAGKTPEEVLPYLLSGEPDDLSHEFFDTI